MYEEPNENTFLGRDYNKNKNFSEIVANEIDEAMRKIINECYTKTQKIIKENKALLKLIAETLLEEETITKEEIDSLVENGRIVKHDEFKDDNIPDNLKQDNTENEKNNETK